jgi:hypothetical protein
MQCKSVFRSQRAAKDRRWLLFQGVWLVCELCEHRFIVSGQKTAFGVPRVPQVYQHFLQLAVHRKPLISKALNREP